MSACLVYLHNVQWDAKGLVLIHHNCISVLYSILSRWCVPMPNFLTTMVSSVQADKCSSQSLLCSHHPSFLIYCQVFPLFFTSSNSTLHHLVLDRPTGLFPSHSNSHLLPSFLLQLFFNGQTTVMTSFLTLINKSQISISLKILLFIV